jgi:peptidoglycan hydrolase-like protein with peptidoglycan-binding domain
MAILIGHSSIDENGKIAGGALGDQTGKEVCTRNWYSASWDVVLRPKSADVAEKSAKFVEAVCANANVGYDQYNRNSLYKLASANGFNGATVGKCECDCSSFMHTAAIAGGAKIYYGSNGATTRTLRTVLGNSGYYDILTDSKYLTSDKYLKRGDIIVNEGSHTIMALQNGSAITPPPAPTPKPTPSNKIAVDGEWGKATTRATQKVLGTPVDGIVSKQIKSCQKYLQNCLTSSWEFKTSNYAGGSAMVKAIQRLVGAGVDGHAGKNTVIAMQKFLNARGFNCGSADGYMGAKTVKAWQKYINSRL